jgi:hypothetical protein
MPFLACITIFSILSRPRYLTTSAGRMYSPSEALIGTSSLTSEGIAPGGTGLPLIGSIILNLQIVV